MLFLYVTIILAGINEEILELQAKDSGGQAHCPSQPLVLLSKILNNIERNKNKQFSRGW
jgi:hypothetical protein